MEFRFELRHLRLDPSKLAHDLCFELAKLGDHHDLRLLQLRVRFGEPRSTSALNLA
jgi:hypothetical protein